MARLFIGLDVPLLAPLVRLIDRLSHLGPSVRPVQPDAMHITLRFLGEVDANHMEQIATAIDAAVCRGRAEYGLSPFDLNLTHVGTFPKSHGGHRDVQPRVMFAAPSDPGPLPRLAAALDESIDGLGLPIAARDLPMDTHITLARIKRRRIPDRRAIQAIDQLMTEANASGLSSMKVKAIKLIESRLGPKGPDYRTRHTSRL